MYASTVHVTSTGTLVNRNDRNQSAELPSFSVMNCVYLYLLIYILFYLFIYLYNCAGDILIQSNIYNLRFLRNVQ